MISRSLGRLSRLQEDRIGDPDLAHVVEEESVLELGIAGKVGNHLPGELECQTRDALGVPSGLVVSKLERDG